jgi:hypothetical protein
MRGNCAKEPTMTKPYKDWHVLPHGELTEIDDGILTVVGHIKMPLMDLPRRMTVVRLNDARLVVWSAIALDDTQMHRLEALGRPTFMIVPNDHHRLDARAWKNRYPRLEVVAPEGARQKVEEIVPVDTTTPDFGDPDVRFMTVPGTREREAALLVRRPNGTTLVLNDLVGNIRETSGLDSWLLKLAHFAGNKAQIPTPVKLTMSRTRTRCAGSSFNGRGSSRSSVLSFRMAIRLKRIHARRSAT